MSLGPVLEVALGLAFIFALLAIIASSIQEIIASALSTRGSNTVVPDSGHNIQHDQPQAVIDAIIKAIAVLRAH